MHNTTSLKTCRCLLRPPCHDDEEFMYSAFTHLSFPKSLPLGQTKSIADVKNWIKQCMDGRNERTVFSFTIESAEGLRKIGQVTLFRDDAQPNAWAIAYWIHPKQWGQGYATEAARKVMEYAFSELGADLVWAGASDWNPASIGTVEKMGMQFTSEIKDAYSIDNESITVKRYEINRQSWNEFLQQKSLVN